MAKLVFYIPEQTYSFDIEDDDQIAMFRQAVIDDEAGDPYVFMEAADIWTSDVHSAIEMEVDFEDD